MPQARFTSTDEIFRGEIPSRLESREGMIDKVLERLTERGCQPDPDPYFDRLCLDEALSNAILHGNGNDPKKKVKVRIFCAKNGWGVEIADEGPGFDWKGELKRIREGINNTEASGRGIALILGTGASLEFLDGGRRLLISRR